MSILSAGIMSDVYCSPSGAPILNEGLAVKQAWTVERPAKPHGAHRWVQATKSSHGVLVSYDRWSLLYHWALGLEGKCKHNTVLSEFLMYCRFFLAINIMKNYVKFRAWTFRPTQPVPEDSNSFYKEVKERHPSGFCKLTLNWASVFRLVKLSCIFDL